MQTATKKLSLESPSPKPTTAKKPDIAFVPVPNTLAVFHVNYETTLTHTHHAVIRAVAGPRFTITVSVDRR